MRRLCVLMVSLLVVGLPETCPAAEVADYQVPQAGDRQIDQAGCCATLDGDSCGGCGGSCRTRGLGSPCWVGLPHARRMAAVGEFNCGCRGSYKFPVPPQYTYHWPGMYSQQMMTEYTSPWRFPPLRSAGGESAQVRLKPGGLIRLPPPPKLDGPDDVETASRARKRDSGWRGVVR